MVNTSKELELIDTHTHLYVDAFDADREAVIQRAMDAGIKSFYLPAIDSTTTQRMLDLRSAYPQHIFLMMGLHPTHVKDNVEAELEYVKNMLQKDLFIAMGEIGIDLYWDTSFLKQQQMAFEKQIQWAKEKGLPIVIHCRDAFDEVFEVLEGQKDTALSGVFHCFTGNLKQAQKAIDFNLKLGIGGVVTFKNGGIDKFLNQIPLENIVLETDAPYLAPVPYRGKRNESSYLIEVLHKVATIYGVSPEVIAHTTSQNAKRVFKNPEESFS